MPRLYATAVACSHNACRALAAVMVLAFLAGCPQVLPPDERPEANFEASPRSGNAPITVSFTNTSRANQAPIVAYNWNFGDGTTSNRPNPTHTYQQPGAYTIRLSVTSADGVHTVERENYIVVSQSSSFTELGGQGGEGIIEGVRFNVPPNALPARTVIGVQRGAEDFIRNTNERIETLSEVFTIFHNGDDTRVYARSGDMGETTPTTIVLPIFGDSVPEGELSPAKIMVLAKLPDGRIVPIPVQVQRNEVTLRITELPRRADYIVVYRPEAQLSALDVEIAFKQDFDFGWPKQWNISYSEALLQQLTALRLGSIEDTPPYARRNFSAAALQRTLNLLRGNMERSQELLEGSGLLIPTLATANGGFNLLFYNMSANYAPDRAFNDVVWADRSFGHLVIDPRALLAITLGNSNAAGDEPDRAQEFNFTNAFVQEVFRAAFTSYQYPKVTTNSPADGRPVAVWESFREGIALYLGQLFDNQPYNRSFSPNERLDLSLPPFAPFAAGKPGYAAASQDFFRFIQRDVVGGNNLAYLLGVTGDTAGVLVELKKTFEAIADRNFPISYEMTLAQLRLAVDRALSEATGVSLSQAYASFATSVALDQANGDAFRPSQEALAPFTLDESRFASNAIVVEAFDAPTDKAEVSANDRSALRTIAPLTSRVIRLQVFPLTTDLTLSFNRNEWLEDEDGNSVAVTVYQKGRSGVVLPEGADTLVLSGFMEGMEGCYDEVYILVSNTAVDKSQNFAVAATAFAGQPVDGSEILDTYLAACDPNYHWEVFSTAILPGTGVRTTVLDIASGAWRGSEDVNQSVWRHFATVVEPPVASNNTALLFVSGGSTGSLSSNALSVLLPFVAASGSVGVFLQSVPNQPLVFADETRTRSEDALIAYSYDQYMNGFDDGNPDMTWPALLPMTRAAVRTMDAVQEYLDTSATSNAVVSNFVVGGASKRGWTTWLTAAGDNRVTGAIPLVIDVLNMDTQIQHHENSLCGFSPALNDYVELGVFDRLGTEAGDALLQIVDPYSYLDRLTMPKFIINSTGDEFFLPDSAQFYYNDLLGEKRLYYAPNTSHGLGGSSGSLGVNQDTFDAMLAWFQAFTRGVVRPAVQWSFEAENIVRVSTLREPSEVRLWQANNPTDRDFRLDILGAAWESTILEPEEDGTYLGEADQPDTGWSSFFVQVTFPGPSPTADFKFSTEARVFPDVYPICPEESAR